MARHVFDFFAQDRKGNVWYFGENTGLFLPDSIVQQRFNYNPQDAAAFSAAEAANYAAAQKQQQNRLDEAQRQQATAAQNLAKVGETQATVNAIFGLEGRYAQIQSEKAVVQQRIHEMRRWHLTRLERADLAALEEQLTALGREESEVKAQMKQVQKAQR